MTSANHVINSVDLLRALRVVAKGLPRPSKACNAWIATGFSNQEVVPQSLGTIEIGSPLWCGPLRCDGLTDVVVGGGPNGIMAWGRRSRQSDAVVTYRRPPNDHIRHNRTLDGVAARSRSDLTSITRPPPCFNRSATSGHPPFAYSS